MSLADAITQLNGEYQDRLEEIENDHPHDRLAITSNDGSYAIAWQDVLAVFAPAQAGRRTARRWHIWTRPTLSGCGRLCGI